MRFVMTEQGMKPTDGALIPELGKKAVEGATEAAADSMTEFFLDKLYEFGLWVVDKGLPILSEFLFVYALFCFLCAITGKGKWMERGFKMLTGSVLVGVAGYAA